MRNVQCLNVTKKKDLNLIEVYEKYSNILASLKKLAKQSSHASVIKWNKKNISKQ